MVDVLHGGGGHIDLGVVPGEFGDQRAPLGLAGEDVEGRPGRDGSDTKGGGQDESEQWLGMAVSYQMWAPWAPRLMMY